MAAVAVTLNRDRWGGARFVPCLGGGRGRGRLRLGRRSLLLLFLLGIFTRLLPSALGRRARRRVSSARLCGRRAAIVHSRRGRGRGGAATILSAALLALFALLLAVLLRLVVLFVSEQLIKEPHTKLLHLGKKELSHRLVGGKVEGLAPVVAAHPHLSPVLEEHLDGLGAPGARGDTQHGLAVLVDSVDIGAHPQEEAHALRPPVACCIPQRRLPVNPLRIGARLEEGREDLLSARPLAGGMAQPGAGEGRASLGVHLHHGRLAVGEQPFDGGRVPARGKGAQEGLGLGGRALAPPAREDEVHDLVVLAVARLGKGEAEEL